jgi:hypothetical protein
MLGDIVATVIALLFLFGSVSMFIGTIVDKHYNKPVKHSAIDNNLDDVIISEVFDDNDT